MATRLQLRRDTATNWTTANPILLGGEMAVETDTGKFKVGDGTTVWTSLVYSSGIQGVAGLDGTDGTDGATWHNDTVDPTTEGVDGDYFLNTTSYDVFEKISGTWTLIGNIDGVDGEGVPIGGATGQVLKKIDGTDYNTEWADESGGNLSFLNLTDSPIAYTGNGGKVVIVNNSEDGIEFTTPLSVYSEGGFITEDFEDDNYVIDMTYSGWNRLTAGGVDGSGCFTNGWAGDNSRILTITFDMPVAGDLVFWMKTASDPSSTHFTRETVVKIDGSKVLGKSTSVWAEYTFPLGAGSHTLEFSAYSNPTSYMVQTWVDNIKIPQDGVYDDIAISNNPDSLLKTDSLGNYIGFIPDDSYMQNLSDDTLPTASEDYRGQIFTVLGGTGVADISYICQKDATDTYVWVAI